MTTVPIPQHDTPRGTWCRFSGADSLSGICWACAPARADDDAPPGALQFHGADGWHTAARPPSPAELDAAARGPDGQFWLTGFSGEPYNATAARSFLDRPVRVVHAYWLRAVPDQDLSGPYTAAGARERLDDGAVMWPEQGLVTRSVAALVAYIVMCRPTDAASLAAHYQNMAGLHDAGVTAWPFTIDLAADGEPERFCTVTYTGEEWILTAGPGPDVTG